VLIDGFFTMMAPQIVIRPIDKESQLDKAYLEETIWGYEVVRTGTLTKNGDSGCWLVYEVRARELEGHLLLEERFQRGMKHPYKQFDIKDFGEREVADEEMKEMAMVHARAHLKKLKPTLVNKTSRA
jgi:hypothetical protein